MPAFDYTELASMVEEMIDEFGRAISLVELDGTSDDLAKPWRGSTAPRTAATTVSATGVFVEPTSVAELGFMATDFQFTKRAEQVLIVSAKKTGANEIEDFHEVVDGAIRWRIEKVHLLKPGATRLLYFIEVKQ